MAHRQEEEQAARKKQGEGAVHEVGPEQRHGRSQPRVDEVFTESSADGADSNEQAPGQGEPGRSGGGGQGRRDQGGEGRSPSDG